jgi:hypothetical protein
MKAQTMQALIVLQIAIECPRPGVRRRKRNAVESLQKQRVTM